MSKSKKYRSKYVSISERSLDCQKRYGLYAAGRQESQSVNESNALSSLKNELEKEIRDTVGAAMLFPHLLIWGLMSEKGKIDSKSGKIKSDEINAYSDHGYKKFAQNTDLDVYVQSIVKLKDEYHDKISRLRQAGRTLEKAKTEKNTGTTVYEEKIEELKKDIKNHALVKLENNNKKFLRDIFDENFLRKLFDAIMFNKYEGAINNIDRDYRIIVSELMLEYAVMELKQYLPSYTQFMGSDLNRVLEIARFIKKQITKQESIKVVNLEF